MSPTDTALRDFSAKCVHEFLRWSIKQATKKVGSEICVFFLKNYYMLFQGNKLSVNYFRK